MTSDRATVLDRDAGAIVGSALPAGLLKTSAIDRPSPWRRFWAAWLYDYLASFWVANCLVGVAAIFLGNTIWTTAPLTALTMSVYLTRDYLFAGRGAGKYLLGLQVIDVATGRPASLTQSVLRNSVLIGPYLIYQLVAQVMIAMPALHSQALLDVLKGAGITYCVVMMIVENTLLYKGFGRRIADRLAGTMVVMQSQEKRS